MSGSVAPAASIPSVNPACFARAAAGRGGRGLGAVLSFRLLYGQAAAHGDAADGHLQGRNPAGTGQLHLGVGSQSAHCCAALDLKLGSLRILAEDQLLHVRVQRHIGAAENLHPLRGNLNPNIPASLGKVDDQRAPASPETRRPG